MQISVIKADFTGTGPRRCSGHRSNTDNWFDGEDLHLALYNLQQHGDCSSPHLAAERRTRFWWVNMLRDASLNRRVQRYPGRVANSNHSIKPQGPRVEPKLDFFELRDHKRFSKSMRSQSPWISQGKCNMQIEHEDNFHYRGPCVLRRHGELLYL